MNIVFAGTPEFAAAALSAILAAGHRVTLVLTQPDRPAGRGMKLAASAVKRLALQHGLPVYQPERLRDPASHEPIRAAGADLMVVAAYGLILPQAVLDLPRLGCINIHASLLPRWRGAAPIQRAILAGDRDTGITLMQMDAGLDTGAMLLQRSLAIEPTDTAATLHDKLAALGASLIVEALGQPGSLVSVPQPAEGVCYAAKISKAEAALDWRRPATELARQVRAFDPFPAASATIRETPLKIWRASVAANAASGAPGEVLSVDDAGIVVACGDGALCLTELQKPGSRRLTAGEFLRGFALNPGEIFSPGA